MLTIDLLRHGALEGGVKYRGHIEESLTDEGRTQMHQVWSRISDEVELIISSPLSRCAEPASAWAAEKQIPCILEPRVKEMHYGDWEGKTMAEIEQLFPGMLAQWRADPSGMQPPGGETPEAFRKRLTTWWDECMLEHDGKHILLITHSGVMRMLITHALAAPIASSRRMAMPYACWSRVRADSKQSTLIFHQGRP